MCKTVTKREAAVQKVGVAGRAGERYTILCMRQRKGESGMPALQNDLTQGSVSRKLIRYAMPLVASSLLQAIYSITDIIIAGHFIGDTGISAINTSSVIMNMLTQLAIGLTVGGNILVGRYFGSGAEEERKKAAGNTLTVVSLPVSCSPPWSCCWPGPSWCC